MNIHAGVFEGIRVPVFQPRFSPLRTNQHWPRGGWHAIVYEVCLKHRVKVSDVMVGTRTRPVSACRWEIIRRMRDEITIKGLPLSSVQIGKRLALDYTSVMYALRRMGGESPTQAKVSRERLRASPAFPQYPHYSQVAQADATEKVLDSKNVLAPCGALDEAGT